ncbi:MurR/RpiR family transcriptional regulator [Ruegeria hyattellae]|uniref:MurR/RpiR family transcriptional regulator n=1 Tax=Ruegeria hyattellae TaxID=3233337 RepID=UPI00355C4823
MDKSNPVKALQSSNRFSTKAVQRLAEFVLSHQNEIPSMSIATVAHAAKVSQTTIVRLCKDIGYSGYREFRAAMVESRGQRRGADLLGLAPSGPEAQSKQFDVIARQVLRLNADALSDTFGLLDYDVLEHVIEQFMSATHIHLIGFGSSSPIAVDIYQRLLQFGLPSSVCSDPLVALTICNNACGGSLIFGISYTGETRDLVDCLKTARKRKLRTIAMTSFASSAAAEAAGTVLISALRGRQTSSESVSSRISQLAIMDILFVGIALRYPSKLELIENTERKLEKKRVAAVSDKT